MRLEGDAPPEGDRTRPPLLERGVVEERVRPAVHDLVAEHRGLGGVDAVHRDRARCGCAPTSSVEPGEVHRLGEAVVERLADDRVVGDLDRRRSTFSWQAASCGKIAAIRSSASIRWIAGGRWRDPAKARRDERARRGSSASGR